MPTALIWDLIANDSASGAFTRVGTAAESSATKVSSLLTKLGGGALLVAGAESLKMAGNFQQATNVLVTAAGESTKNLDLIRKGILNISTTTGTSWQQVTDAMYTLEKAGYRGADALKVEKAAAQGAREENANLATVTNAMTSIMASYHLKVSDSVSVMNQLKTAAGESKTTMELFAGALSTVLPVASANKISFADVAGSMATLTQHGTSADEATQELSNTIRNLSAPNAVAQKEMAQLGISAVDVAQNVGDGPGGRGLAGTLNYLSQTVLQKMGPAGTLLLSTFNASKTATADANKMFQYLPPAVQKVAQSYKDGTISLKDYRTAVKALPADQAALASQWAMTENAAQGFQQTLRTGLNDNQTYTDAIKKMTGGANGLNTTLQITGDSMAGTNDRIKAVSDAAKAAGTNVSGWESTQKLFNVQMDKFKQSAEAAGIELGTKLIPFLSSSAGWAAKHTDVILGLVGAFVGYKAAMLAVTAAQALWAAGELVVNGAVALLGATVGSTTLGLSAFIAESEAAAAAEVGIGVAAEEAAATTDAALASTGPLGLAMAGIGILVGGAVAAFGLFGSKAKEQVKPVQELTDAITRDGNAIGALTTAQVNNKLTNDGTYDAARKLGISSSTVLQATLGNVGAQKEIAAATKVATEAYNKANTAIIGVSSSTRSAVPVYGHATDAQVALKTAADKLTGAVDGENASLNASVQAAKDSQDALNGLDRKASTAGGHIIDLFRDLGDVGKTNVKPIIDTSSIDNATVKASAFQTLILSILTPKVPPPNTTSIPIPGAPSPGRATGDPSWQGGSLWAGENGPEHIWLPKGSKIDSAQNSKSGPVDQSAVVQALQEQTASLTQAVNDLAQSIDGSVKTAAVQGAQATNLRGAAGTSQAYS
jgi:hypothetical protein